jgi:hypothetical protein
MEIAYSLRRLWHLRLWVVVVAIVAMLGSLALTENVSLFPPSLKTEQGIEFGAASTSLLVDSSGSAVGDLRKPLEPLTGRAALMAMLIRSKPVQLRISKAMRLPFGTIATSVTIPNPQNPSQPPNESAGEQASALVGQSAAYQIAVAPVPEVPIINLSTQAPTGTQAIALAKATTVAVSSYLAELQREGAVPTLSRAKLRTLGSASGGNVNPGAGRSIAVLVFFVIFILGCVLVLGISRIAQDFRISKELEEPSQPAPSAFEPGSRPPVD